MEVLKELVKAKLEDRLMHFWGGNAYNKVSTSKHIM